MPNFFGQQGQPGMGQPGMGQPQQGGPQPMPGPPQPGQMPGGPPQQQRQAQPAMGGGIQPGMQIPPGLIAGTGGMGKPDDSFVRQAEQALMQAQMSGAMPSQIAQMQMNLQNAQRDYQQSMGNYEQDQRRQYLEGIQQASRPVGAGSIGGWGQTSGPTSQLQQDPMLGQLMQNQFGQGFSTGGGPRS